MSKTSLKLVSVLLTLAMFFVFAVPVFAAGAAEKPFEDSLFYEEGDYRIHYRVIPAEGEHKGNILFLHGFLYSGESFASMAENMSKEGYTCVLADFPNFGYSTRETAETEKIDREELMAGLMKSIAPLETWTVAGQSMGGGVALNIACEYPEINALLLIAPAQINEVSPAIKNLASSEITSFFFNSTLKVMLKLNALVRLFMYMATMDKEYTKAYDLSVLTAPLAVEGTGDGLINMMLNARPTDFDAVSKLEMPILLFRGDKDKIVGKSLSDQLDKALINAEKITIAGGGHMINETHADELSKASCKFLANH